MAAQLLRNKVAIVTGGGRGMGAEIARTFACHGAKIVLNDINADAGEAAAKLENVRMLLEHV